MTTVKLTIGARKVPADKLASLLGGLHGDGRFQYLIVSDWREIRFVRFQDREPAWIERSDSGRAFGLQAEVKWRRDANGKDFRCRWISDDGSEPGDGWEELPENDLQDLAADESLTGYLLWGEWLAEANCWYTARIPRRLEYPTDEHGKTPLTLQVRHYRRGGQTYFERFVGLARYEGPQPVQRQGG